MFNVKALVGAFNQEKALVGAFSVIVKADCGTDGSFYSTSLRPPLPYSVRCVCNVSGVAGPINLSPPDCHLGYLVISTAHSDILAIYSGD